MTAAGSQAEKGLSTVTKKYGGIILLRPDRLTLTICDDHQHILTQVQSGALRVGDDQVANYLENMEAITTNLVGFQRVLKEYAVEPDRVALYGDLADLDPVSAQYVGDQVAVRVGLKLRWLNKNQLLAQTLSLVWPRFKHALGDQQLTGYVLSVGLESSTLAAYKNGEFVTSWDIDLGKARINHLAENLRQTTATPSDIITDFISSKLEYLVSELSGQAAPVLLVQGVETLAQRYIQEGQHFAPVDQTSFKNRYRRILTASDQYIIHQYAVDEQSVNWVLPSYLVVRQTMRLLRARRLYVTDLVQPSGLLAASADRTPVDHLVTLAADQLAARYGSDADHKEFVTAVSSQLFDALAPIHRLGDHYRLLLKLACKVDDIGNFINPQGHYRHSAYIIEANPLIGISDEDNQIIAEVSRYHSSEAPEINQHHYRELSADLRLPVAQLAAILRVADSLDDSRQQKITAISLKLKDDRLLIKAKAKDDLVLEKWAFLRKNKLFTQVYGLKPVLVVKGGK